MPGPVTIRLVAPGSGRGPSTVHGNKPSNSAGTIVDLPPNSDDINILRANGWSQVGGSGTTAQRPSVVNLNDFYVDTTLSKVIVYDGSGWRDPVSGAAV